VLAWYTVSVRHELYQAEQRQYRNGADDVARLAAAMAAGRPGRSAAAALRSRQNSADDSANPALQLRCV